MQVKKYNPNAKMVLRILTDDSKSVCRYVSGPGGGPPSPLLAPPTSS